MLIQNKFYFLKRDNRVFGPFPAAKLDTMCRDGVIPRDSPISSDKVAWDTLENLFYQANETETPRLTPISTSFTAPATSAIPGMKQQTQQSAAPDTTQLQPFLIPLVSAWRVIGDTLQLIWNTCDKIDSLLVASHPKKSLLTAGTAGVFSLFLELAAGASISIGTGHVLRNILIVFVFTLLALGLLAIEFTALGILRKKSQDSIYGGILMSAASALNLAVPACVGMLYYLLLRLSGGHDSPAVFAVSLFLFLCILFSVCFSLANLTAGMYQGLTMIYGLRPRAAVWFCAVQTTLHLLCFSLCIYFIEFIVKTKINPS